MDGGAALEEGVGIGGNEGLVGEGDEEAKDEEVELEMAEEAVGAVGERVVRSGGVISGRLEVVLGGADEMVESQGEQSRGCDLGLPLLLRILSPHR